MGATPKKKNTPASKRGYSSSQVSKRPTHSTQASSTVAAARAQKKQNAANAKQHAVASGVVASKRPQATTGSPNMRQKTESLGAGARTSKQSADRQPSQSGAQWLAGLKQGKPKNVVGLIILLLFLVAFGYMGYQGFAGGTDDGDDLGTGTGALNNNVHGMNVDEPAPVVQSLVPRHLDGVIVPNGQENPQPVAVMVENLSSVRPHSGLQGASVVYETVAEAGITRFMAVYAGAGDEPEIRPVRSARPYYLEWAAEVDAVYAHAGGSPNALRTISAFDYKDMNALGLAARFFWRGAGAAPHNLYTSSEKLALALRDNDWNGPRIEYKSWQFDDDPADLEDREIRKITEPAKKLPVKADSDVIEVGFGGAYAVRFEYDPERNVWMRWNGGREHIDKNTGEQITATNVIVQRVPPVGLESEKGRVIMNVTGEGQAWTCHDGLCTEGRWKKESRERRTLWYEKNADGSTNLKEELHLTRGNTWVIVVPEPYDITIRKQES